MRLRRWTGVGVGTALIAGGCASEPKQTAAPAVGGPPAAPAVAPAEDRPQYEVRRQHTGVPSPSEVAERANRYAAAMGTPSAAPPTPGKPSSVQFDSPPETPASATPIKLIRPRLVAAPPPVDEPTAAAANPRVGVLQSAVAASPLSDLPQAVPESADFAEPANPPPSTSDPLARRLERQAKARPTDPAAQFDYQLYAMLSDGTGTGPMLAAVAGLPADERDVVAAVVDGVNNFRGNLRADPNATATRQIRPLQAMVERLRSAADLAVSTVALCKRVEGFGRYDPISPSDAPATLPAGRANRVIVYCEVDNAQPRQTPAGQWETRLTQRVSVYAADGSLAVPNPTDRPTTDVCRDRRRDFFAYELITLPATLAPGPYRVRVTITDRNANKMAEADAPVTIAP